MFPTESVDIILEVFPVNAEICLSLFQPSKDFSHMFFALCLHHQSL